MFKALLAFILSIFGVMTPTPTPAVTAVTPMPTATASAELLASTPTVYVVQPTITVAPKKPLTGEDLINIAKDAHENGTDAYEGYKKAFGQ